MNDMLIFKYMKAGHAMMNFSKMFKSYMKSQLAEENLSFAEGVTIVSLLETDGLSAEMLLRKVSYDKSVMTRTLQALEDKELVARERNPEDGRSWLFTLSEQGATKAKFVMNVMTNWAELACYGMSESQIEELNALLNQLVENASKGE